jgi:hypothetical protein
MQPADVTALTGAFDPADLLSTFIAFAPFIITVVGIVLGVALAKWGIKKVSGKLNKGV